MSTAIRLPLVHGQGVQGRVSQIHRPPGAFAAKEDVILEVEYTDVFTLAIRAPFDGKIMWCAEKDSWVRPEDRLTEITSVGLPTWELFIAYRENDESGRARRIGEHMIRAFGRGQVFQDVASLTMGNEFAAVIRDRLQRACVMVVVIGPQWASNPRLHEAHDLHREEIRTAIDRRIAVIPVLVNGAAVPSGADLPEDIRPLFDRIAHPMDDTKWPNDIEALERVIADSLANSEKRNSFLAQVPPNEHGGWQFIVNEPLDES